MFSIVIPLYNKELSIKSTIQSVLDQTYQDFEIIVVNDGSTDSSPTIVDSINDDRIRIINQTNQGVSSARNRGITEANNNWIAFLDGDDLWKENHLEEVMKMIDLFPDEKVYVTSFEYSDNREMFRHQRQTSIFKIGNYFKEAMQESLICTGIIVINKECFKKVGVFRSILKNGEDLELWARLAKKYDIIKSSVVTAIYRVDAENSTSLNKNVKQTHVYYFNLGSTLDSDEKKYYKYLILRRLYEYLRVGDVFNVIKLKTKHPEISHNEFILFVLKYIKNRLKEF